MSTVLLVPIRVDGVFLSSPRSVVGPPGFHRLPYVRENPDGTYTDVRATTPFLGESVHLPPFNDTDTVLGAGVHLHWILPQALRSAAHPGLVDQEGVDEARLAFRRAPNRWLIQRFDDDDAPTAAQTWLLHSDHVWPVADTPDATQGAIWPWDIAVDAGAPPPSAPAGTPPWRNVGRAWKLTTPGVEPTDGAPICPRPSESLPDGLRANGWGDPTFAGYYPACRSVFGVVDDTPRRPAQTARYEVIGWYDAPTAPDHWGASDPATRISALPDGAARKAAFLADYNWDVEEGSGGPPTRTLFVGRLRVADLSPLPGSEPEFKVAVAETGAEALAAGLARAVAVARHPSQEEAAVDADARRVEEHLDALLLEASGAGDLVDVGHALRQARHRAGFRALQAWPRRSLRPPTNAAADAGGVAATAALEQSVATANAAVEAAWFALRAREALQGQLFSDWYRAVKVDLPPVGRLNDWPLDQATDGSVTGDHLYQYIRQTTIPALDGVAALVAQNAQRADQALAALQAQIAAQAPAAAPAVAGTTTPPATAGSGLEVVVGVEPAFFAPADPVVALLPAEACTVDRWCEDGLARAASGGLVTGLGTLADDLLTDPTESAGLADLNAQSDEVQRTLADAVRALLDQSAPQVLGSHLHAFCMDWSVEFRPSASLAGHDGTLALVEGVDEGEVIAGRSLVTHNASLVLRTRLGGYIQRRLREPVVSLDPDNSLLHPLTAALAPPEGMRKVSWEDREGWSHPNDYPGRLPDEVRLWARELTATERMLASGQACAEWQDASHPLGIDPSGPLAAAIVGMLAARPDGLSAFLTTTLALPPDLASGVADHAADLRAMWTNLAYGKEAVLARLLQQADAEGWIGPSPTTLPERVLARPAVLGLPRGGVVEAVVTALVNQFGQDDALMDEVGLDAAVVGPILGALPIQDLDDLATVEHVTAHTAGLLLRYADQAGRFTTCTPQGSPTSDSSALPDAGKVDLADPLRTAIAAWDELQDMPAAMVHSLAGFHDALLQWSNTPQLGVDAPLAFSNYRAFATQVVAPRVGSAPRRAPLPNAGFHPVRGGDLRIRYLRLIDTFGMPRDVVPTEFVPPVTRRSADGLRLTMPPRITQAARIRVDWCPSPGSADPIVGWLVADNATGSIVVHDAAGEMLGSIDHRGRWRVAPGELGPVAPGGIDDPQLRALVRRLQGIVVADEDPEVAMAGLLDAIDRALEQIQPPNTPVREVMALVTSRPVAVARCAVSVELRDPPAARQDLASLVASVAGEDPAPTFPAQVGLQLGHHRLLADGVVGFYLQDDDGSLADDLRMPSAQTNEFAVPIGGASPQRALVLLDPRGVIHVAAGLRAPDAPDEEPTSWLLPAREIRLAPADYAPALARIDVRLRVGPLLVPAGGVELPMPFVAGGGPSFLYLEDGRWQELGRTPQVSKAQLLDAFPADPGLWGRLVDAGALVPFPGRPEVASVPPAPRPTLPGHVPTLRDLFATEPQADAIARFLQAEARHLRAPGLTTTDTPRELREGWLRIRSEHSN